MNVCPVLPAPGKVREGVLDDERAIDGLGRLNVRRLRKLAPHRHLHKHAPHNLLRGRRHHRGRGLKGALARISPPSPVTTVSLAPGVVPTIGSWNESATEAMYDDGGLGRFRPPHKRLKKRLKKALKKGALHKALGKHAPHKRLGRKKRKKRGGLAALLAARAAVAPVNIVAPGVIPPIGAWGDEGLGKLRIGKKLKKARKKLKKVRKKIHKVGKKIIKSKAFRIAAIGAAAWFTGGLALKAAPALLGKGKILGMAFKGGKKLLSRKRRKSIADAAQTYMEAQNVPTVPGSEADPYGYGAAPSYYYGGGGGGESYGGGGGGGDWRSAMQAGFVPGMTDEEEIEAAEGRPADTGASLGKLLVPLAIGIPLLMALSSGGRRR